MSVECDNCGCSQFVITWDDGAKEYVIRCDGCGADLDAFKVTIR